MRVFVAVDVSEEIKLKAHEVQEIIDRLAIDIKFVELHNIHFTLKFIGEASDGDIAKIEQAMLSVAKLFSPFELHIKGLLAFPRPTYARVVACATQEGKETLTALANTLSKELAELGFAAEMRPFEPHLTIARIRTPTTKPELITLLKELENKEIGKTVVTSMKLVQSVLTRQGPIYKDIFVAKLG